MHKPIGGHKSYMDGENSRAKHFEPDFVRMVLGKQQVHGFAAVLLVKIPDMLEGRASAK